MKISAKAEYACLAMLALAKNRHEAAPLRIREIAEANKIPERYLVQILLQLKGAGLVASIRGASGGYRIARPPSEISVGAVLDAIDGPDEPSRSPNGPLAAALSNVWREVRVAQKAILDRTSIDEVSEKTTPREWII